jgi:hypothetical protein
VQDRDVFSFGTQNLNVLLLCLSGGGRESPNPCDFALVATLGPLGLPIFEAAGAGIADLGEEDGHRVLRLRGYLPGYV